MFGRLGGFKATEGVAKPSLDDVCDAPALAMFAVRATPAMLMTMLFLFNGA
jgi:hypothetical protein